MAKWLTRLASDLEVVSSNSGLMLPWAIVNQCISLSSPKSIIRYRANGGDAS